MKHGPLIETHKYGIVGVRENQQLFTWPKPSDYRGIWKGTESTLVISQSFKRGEKEVVAEGAILHLSRQNETKRKRQGRKD